MAEIRQEDYTQLFSGCLLLIQDELGYVTGVRGGTIEYRHLASGESRMVAYKDGVIRNLTRRIGYVNIDGVAMYMYRNPVRRMCIGYSNAGVEANFRVMTIGRLKAAARDKLFALTAPEIVNSYEGKYPTLKEAVAMITSKGLKSVAFDKQFAVERVGEEFLIWYRTSCVGKVPVRSATIKNIKFNEGYDYLLTLLEDIREKSLRPIGA